MTKRMLIDATHAEETRVVVLDGNRLEDYDVETSTKKQLKGNIYLAKVVRVEPSLQAAFVEYGGGRHGFLAFGEIHPDYYQIPVADRQRLLEMQAEEARAEEEEEDAAAEAPAAPQRRRRPERAEADRAAAEGDETGADTAAPAAADDVTDVMAADPREAPAQPAAIVQEVKFGELAFGAVNHGELDLAPPAGDGEQPAMETAPEGESDLDIPRADVPPPEIIGGDSDVFEGNSAEEARARRSARFLRNYRIQEVIRRRQIMLVQVVKEERGTKGAALTTYISLAGRYCVLMPNSPRGGGISRKITSAADRRRLKEITAELDIPQGMGLIVRTAGANRPKPEIKRDCEYLMRLWDDIREHTLRSVAPALIYEEASLIKRAIRDVYSRDVDEILVDGEAGWKAAHDFMRMLMPSHAKKVQLWRDERQPLFSKMGVEAQLEAMMSPTVQLRSGGYLVINQTEALVAIDVNSGRSTRERGIEETALRTNLEAADEAARQLRLRDLAGLIVIDFIDMESKKHNAMVERRLKEALKNDRARIQVGHISHFGLLEMSRQRLRPSLAETNFVVCPHCGGLGHVRSVESSAIHVLRAIEEEGAKGRAALITVHAANAVAMYILNNKRDRLAEIEARDAMRVHFAADDSLVPPQIRIDRVRPQVPEAERAIAAPVAPAAPALEISDETEDEDIIEAADETPAEDAATGSAEAQAAAEESEHRRRRRRRRRGGRRDGTGAEGAAADGERATESEAEAEAEGVAEMETAAGAEAATVPEIAGADPGAAADVAAEAESVADLALAEQPSLDAADLDENGLPRARRRGRRGGRRRRRDAPGEAALLEEEIPAAPVYTGPTPADPFGGHTYDIFDMIEQAVEAPARPAVVEAPAPAEPVAAALEIPPVPVNATAPADVEPVVEASAEAPAPAADAAPLAVPESVAAPEPAAAPEPVAAPELVPAPVVAPVPVMESAPEPAAPEPAAPVAPELPAAPAIKPIVIGQDTLPDAQPKRGWWRR
ncbi:Rne/Rng family ribonuclease [Limobrevibacterium gyesilva]|uniref:Ribonuclease E n=1 Tax=Limobrevibacterium gyesilva TaxID=2991712 RepID=A0AA41YQ76_9PROT|nr:ribonuclease E/G [Limobrevibacterium gyesilva]MCW3476711.1 ribonuclease E/G [Limobrevibacterium gyesilva]